MKTNGSTEAPAAASQPGNVSVRQLAASLMKTPATAKQPEDGNSEGGTAENHEAQPPNDGKPNKENPNEGNETENLEQEHAEGTETEAAAEHADAATDTESTEATESTETETAESETAENAEGAKTGMPEELKDAIELAKGEGKKGVAQLLGRVHKLVDERDTHRNARLAAEEQVSQLRQELQDARSQKSEVRSQNDFAHPAIAKVTEELGNVDYWLGWCEANPEGGEVPDGDRDKAELNADQVKQLRTRLERERTEIVARKVQTEREVKTAYDQQYAQHHTAALASYPALKNPNSPESQEMQAVLKFFPQLKASPDHELAIADMMAGKALRLAKAKAANGNSAAIRKPAPQREPTKVVAQPPSTSAARKAPEKVKKDEADATFQKSGRMTDLAKTFAASRRVSRTGG